MRFLLNLFPGPGRVAALRVKGCSSERRASVDISFPAARPIRPVRPGALVSWALARSDKWLYGYILSV
jgi:hypothetical protein